MNLSQRNIKKGCRVVHVIQCLFSNPCPNKLFCIPTVIAALPPPSATSLHHQKLNMPPKPLRFQPFP